MTVKRATRAKAFAAIRALKERRRANGPTLFNPHYEIRGRAVQDPSVSSKTGPQLKTQQWEATGRRISNWAS